MGNTHQTICLASQMVQMFQNVNIVDIHGYCQRYIWDFYDLESHLATGIYRGDRGTRVIMYKNGI